LSANDNYYHLSLQVSLFPFLGYENV
jgi:hypothetical protein